MVVRRVLQGFLQYFLRLCIAAEIQEQIRLADRINVIRLRNCFGANYCHTGKIASLGRRRCRCGNAPGYRAGLFTLPAACSLLAAAQH